MSVGRPAGQEWREEESCGRGLPRSGGGWKLLPEVAIVAPKGAQQEASRRVGEQKDRG